MAPGTKSGPDEGRNNHEKEAQQVLDSLFEYFDEKHGFLINRLRDFVEFETVSSDPSKKGELVRMGEYLLGIFKKFKLKSTVMNMINKEEPEGGNEDEVVPLILAETEIDPSKRTVLFYCHYDVYPISYHECWSDPFELTITNDESQLYGKGASAGKGPLLCVINALGAYQRNKIPLPANVKIIVDPLGTSGDDVTGKFLRRVDTDFFFNVDFVCLCMGRWLGPMRPCVSHGARGLCHFTVEVEGPSKDLHSGVYGGLFNEPLADLIYLLNSLVDKNGVIRVTDIYENVSPITKEERKFFKSIAFSVRDFQQEIGAKELQVNEDKASILMRLWRQPSLSIHGIQGAFSGPGTKNVIPGKVTGKFSINIVPNMSPSKVKKKVVDYLAKVWKTRKSSNKVRVQMTIGKLFWYTDPSNLNVIAAKNAVAKVCSVEPDLIREGKRIRIANVLRKLTEAPVVMIPIGKSNDVSDTDSEKIEVVNYINGCKIFAAYLKFLAELFPKVKTPEEIICTCKVTGNIESCKCYLQYVPAELEMENQVSVDWSISKMLSAGASTDDKPAFKYYYLSMIVTKRMQKLQAVMSKSHLMPIEPSSTMIFKDEQLSQASHKGTEHTGDMAETCSRAVLQSFSVADLHDTSKPRTGGWLLPKGQKSTNKRESSSPSVALEDTGQVKAVEQSANAIPEPQQQPEETVHALQPTVFSFRLAQTLKKRAVSPFSSPEYKVLRNIKSISLEPLGEKTAGEAPGGTPSKKISPKKTALRKTASDKWPRAIKAPSAGKLKSGSKSFPDLSKEGMAFQTTSAAPNPTHHISAANALSSTSRIMYNKRLEKEITDSMRSVISMNPSFRIPSTSNTTSKVINEEQTLSSIQPSVNSNPQPGDPIRPSGVVSSLSAIMFHKRLDKKITDSTREIKSGSVAPDAQFNQVSAELQPDVTVAINSPTSTQEKTE